MKNILNKITTKYFYVSILISFCFIKNIYFFNANTKWLTYGMILYTLFIVLYRLIFCRYMFAYKFCIVPYILIISTILSSVINHSFFKYDNIKVVILFIQSFLVILPNDIDKDVSTNNYEFNMFLLYTNILFILFTVLSYIRTFIDGRYSRPFGINNDYITFSQIAYMSSAISLYLLFYFSNKLYKIILFFCFVIQLITVVLIQQRAAYLSVFVGIIFLFITARILKSDMKILKKYLKCIVIVVLFIILCLIVFNFSFNIFDFSVIGKKINTMSLSGRDIILDCGFKTMQYKNTYVFGSSRGLLSNHWSEFMYSHKDWFDIYIADNKYFERLCSEAASHSSFFEQLFNHGIVGFIPLIIFYIIIIISLFKFDNIILYYKKQDNYNFVYLASFIIPAIIVTSIFDRNLFFDMIFPINVIFFVFVGHLFYLLCCIK